MSDKTNGSKTDQFTDFPGGDIFHVDVAVGQYLSKEFKVGLVGYAWTQFTGDSGDDATLGDFKSEVYGAGPAVDYLLKVGKTDVDLQLRWYYEYESNNRFEGDAFYFSAAFAF